MLEKAVNKIQELLSNPSITYENFLENKQLTLLLGQLQYLYDFSDIELFFRLEKLRNEGLLNHPLYGKFLIRHCIEGLKHYPDIGYDFIHFKNNGLFQTYGIYLVQLYNEHRYYAAYQLAYALSALKDEGLLKHNQFRSKILKFILNKPEEAIYFTKCIIALFKENLLSKYLDVLIYKMPQAWCRNFSNFIFLLYENNLLREYHTDIPELTKPNALIKYYYPVVSLNTLKSLGVISIKAYRNLIMSILLRHPNEATIAINFLEKVAKVGLLNNQQNANIVIALLNSHLGKRHIGELSSLGNTLPALFEAGIFGSDYRKQVIELIHTSKNPIDLSFALHTDLLKNPIVRQTLLRTISSNPSSCEDIRDIVYPLKIADKLNTYFLKFLNAYTNASPKDQNLMILALNTYEHAGFFNNKRIYCTYENFAIHYTVTGPLFNQGPCVTPKRSEYRGVISALNLTAFPQYKGEELIKESFHEILAITSARGHTQSETKIKNYLDLILSQPKIALAGRACQSQEELDYFISTHLNQHTQEPKPAPNRHKKLGLFKLSDKKEVEKPITPLRIAKM